MQLTMYRTSVSNYNTALFFLCAVVVAMFSQDLYVEQEGNSVQVCLQLMGVAQVTINFEITATDITATGI